MFVFLYVKTLVFLYVFWTDARKLFKLNIVKLFLEICSQIDDQADMFLSMAIFVNVALRSPSGSGFAIIPLV